MEKGCYYIYKDSRGVCKRSGHPDTCRTNINYCKKDADVYHKLCDRYWDITDDEIENMTEKEVDNAIEEIDVCLYMRKRHMDTCVENGCQDRGHEGAITKISNKLKKIKAQKYDSRLNDLYDRFIKMTNVTDSQIDTLIEDSIKKDITSPIEKTKVINLPSIRRPLDYEKYVDDVARNIGSKVTVLPPNDIIPLYNISIKLPSGQDIIGVGDDAKEAYKELTEYLVDHYGTKQYKDMYKRALNEPQSVLNPSAPAFVIQPDRGTHRYRGRRH